MKKAVKSIISIAMLLLVIFMIVLASYNVHEHVCEHTVCIKCELLRSVSDLILLFLIIFTVLALVPYVVSLLALILTRHRGAVDLTPIKLRDKLSN